MASFSIIIPVYNAAATLAETLSSVAQQTLADYEVLVVNDGSTDESMEVLQAHSKRLQKLTSINQQNLGLGAARNMAAKAASGDWLVFLDADDLWAPNKLRVLFEQISKNTEGDFFYHAVFERFPNGSMRKRSFWDVASVHDFVEKGNPFVPSAVAIKREVFMAHGGFVEDRNQVEDLFLWFRLLGAQVKMVAFNNPLTIYRVGQGVTAQLDLHVKKVESAVQMAVKEGLLNQIQAQTFLARKNYEAARQLHKLGRFTEAMGYYRKCSGPTFKQRLLQNVCAWHLSV